MTPTSLASPEQLPVTDIMSPFPPALVDQRGLNATLSPPLRLVLAPWARLNATLSQPVGPAPGLLGQLNVTLSPPLVALGGQSELRATMTLLLRRVTALPEHTPVEVATRLRLPRVIAQPARTLTVPVTRTQQLEMVRSGLVTDHLLAVRLFRLHLCHLSRLFNVWSQIRPG
jgi:hypothetical protein